MPKAERVRSEELTLASRGYRILDVLGKGTYGKVYLAEYDRASTVSKEVASNFKNSRQLACKIIDTSNTSSDFIRKFLPRELEILSKVKHPHLIYIHSIFQRKGKYYIFMRYAELGDLLEFIVKKGAIAERQSRLWMHQMSLAVQYLHAMEIAHRDLKCENLLITSNHNVKLSDFGFARHTIDVNGKDMRSQTYCGSLAYSAPEVVAGSPYYPKGADVWSMGVVLYVMLNKSMPFIDDNVQHLYDQQVNKEWKLRTKVSGMVSEPVKRLLKKTLEPEVEKRYSVDQVLSSEWFAMDSKLRIRSPEETAGMEHAQEERAKYIESLKATKKSSLRSISVWKELQPFPLTSQLAS